MAPASPVPAYNQPVPNHKLAPVGDLLKEAWKLFRSRIWRFFQVSLALVILYVLIFAIVVFGFIFYKFSHGNLIFLIAYIVIGLAVSIYFYYLILRLAITQRYVAIYEKQSFGEYFALSKGKVGQFFWIGILVAASVIGGTILFIIPGIVMGIALTFTGWIYLVEDKRGFEALQQSRKYAYLRMWGILGRAFLAGIIAGIAGAVVQFIFADYKTVSSVLGAVVNFLTTGFLTSFSFLLYKSAAETVYPDFQPKAWQIKTLMWICVAAIALILGFSIYSIFIHALR